MFSAEEFDKEALMHGINARVVGEGLQCTAGSFAYIFFTCPCGRKSISLRFTNQVSVVEMVRRFYTHLVTDDGYTIDEIGVCLI